MNAELIIGLRMGVVGLSVTFLALGALLLVMKLLLRIFPVERTQEKVPLSTTAADAEISLQEEMAVALAVGICLLEHSGSFHFKDPSLGKLLE